MRTFNSLVIGLVIAASILLVFHSFPQHKFALFTAFFVVGSVYYLFKTVMSFLEDGQTSPWLFTGFIVCVAMSIRSSMFLTDYFNIW